ncbi:MAG TPA: hypothetical protein VGO07_04770 [Candidatus Saccharimonadales bacterium]|jgi:hypothetical protein|nr:hypothetical protein [Candidatus Saccharimonadales bacterium]
MFQRSSQVKTSQVSGKRKISNKLIAGFAALSATAIITASGFAAAATPVSSGSGYGGSTSVATNINLSINHSNNNIIQVIVNIFH